MSTKSLSGFVVAMLATIVFAVGCQEPSDTGDHDHDHGHGEHGHVHGPDCDHSHGDEHASHGKADHPPHGPNHGHLFDLDSDEFSCEWCQYKDNSEIRFYLLDAKAESPKPLVVEKFLVIPMTGNEKEPFEMEPENVDPEGAAHVFSLDDSTLRTGINLGVEVEIVTEGKTLKGQIKAHKARDH